MYIYTVCQPNNPLDTFEVESPERGLDFIDLIEDWYYDDEMGEEVPIGKAYPVVSFRLKTDKNKLDAWDEEDLPF